MGLKRVSGRIRRLEFGIGALLEGDGRVVVKYMRHRYQSLLVSTGV